ncbi:MAG: hypothetical protein EOO43_14235, partial [Flavobacterium sp.]
MRYLRVFVFVISVLYSFQSFAQPWSANKIGLDSSVPLPWTPLKVVKNDQGIIVKCWGRSYYFDGRGLLTQIVAQDQKILSQPLSFVVDNYKQNTSSFKIVKISEAEVVLQNTINYRDKGLLTLNISISYDGLVYYKLKYQSNQLSRQTLKISIPIANNIAKYIHRPADPSLNKTGSWKTGLLSEVMGVVDYSAYMSYFWIGDQNSGLTWFMESPINWPNYKAQDAVEITRTKYGTKAILNLGNKNQYK